MLKIVFVFRRWPPVFNWDSTTLFDLHQMLRVDQYVAWTSGNLHTPVHQVRQIGQVCVQKVVQLQQNKPSDLCDILSINFFKGHMCLLRKRCIWWRIGKGISQTFFISVSLQSGVGSEGDASLAELFTDMRWTWTLFSFPGLDYRPLLASCDLTVAVVSIFPVYRQVRSLHSLECARCWTGSHQGAWRRVLGAGWSRHCPHVHEALHVTKHSPRLADRQ